MLPHHKEIGKGNGVGQVLFNYHKWFPKVGVEIITDKFADFDLSCSHLGYYNTADIHFSHGLYFGEIDDRFAECNQNIINAIRNAKSIVVPSEYVAQTFRRELKVNPHVVPHAVNIAEWSQKENKGYVLWNKNRNTNVCNPEPLYKLALKNPQTEFVTTFAPEDVDPIDNVKVSGSLTFDKMKSTIQNASIYLSTAKETFGIGTLEALACGIPVLGYNWGGTKNIVTHKKDGYLVKPNDYNTLNEGLNWLTENRHLLIENCRQKAKQYTWLAVVKKLKGIFENYVN